MKQPIRLFALGMLTASLVTLIFYLFVKDGPQNTDNLAYEDMITALQDEGYHVLNDSDYIALSARDRNDKDVEKNEKKQSESSEKQKRNNQDKERSYTIHIKSDMIPSEISDKLEEKDIIHDASKFNEYLMDNNWDQQIQLGKFDVSSSMDKKEIAETITD